MQIICTVNRVTDAFGHPCFAHKQVGGAICQELKPNIHLFMLFTLVKRANSHLFRRWNKQYLSFLHGKLLKQVARLSLKALWNK